ncbi:MAG: hypothetical protein ACRYG8_47815 [Janthinobacterium lividum]
MSPTIQTGPGVVLPNGCRITHGEGATVRTPFSTMALVMHELHPGHAEPGVPGFRGQYGVIPFTAEFRLPRHVHLGRAERTADASLVAERILVANGAALTELSGEIVLVLPGTLVDIPPGVPHTWTACPAGVPLPDGTVSGGSFLMIYDYAEPTGFYPTDGTATLASASEYRPYAGDLEAISFPRLTPEQVAGQASYIWNRERRCDFRAAG